MGRPLTAHWKVERWLGQALGAGGELRAPGSGGGGALRTLMSLQYWCMIDFNGVQGRIRIGRGMKVQRGRKTKEEGY